MNGITNNLLDGFNKMLEDKRSIIRLISRDNVVDIKLIKDDYLKMEDQIINPSKEFYEDLEKYFSNKGVKITYNNIGSCFWATFVNE